MICFFCETPIPEGRPVAWMDSTVQEHFTKPSIGLPCCVPCLEVIQRDHPTDPPEVF